MLPVNESKSKPCDYDQYSSKEITISIISRRGSLVKQQKMLASLSIQGLKN